jgi:hypothetical protein
LIGPVVVFWVRFWLVFGLVFLGAFEDVLVGVTFDEGVVDFEEACFEAAGAVGEAVSAGEPLIEEVLAFLEVSRIVDAEADVLWVCWVCHALPGGLGMCG